MYILDRFEKNTAIIEHTNENGEIFVISADKSEISPEAAEGDVLVFDNSVYTVDKEATLNRRREIAEKLRTLIE